MADGYEDLCLRLAGREPAERTGAATAVLDLVAAERATSWDDLPPEPSEPEQRGAHLLEESRWSVR